MLAHLALAAFLTAQPPAPPDTSAADAAEAGHLRNIRQVTSGFAKAGEGYFRPDGKGIIFQAVPAPVASILATPRPNQDDYQIYAADLEPNSVPRMVSTGKGKTTCSYYHPDGKSILFASSHLDPAITEGKVDGPKGPAYSRTGASYRWDFDPHMDIFKAKPDGSDLVRLTETPGYDAEGSYSPDGKSIVFTSFRDGDAEIYIMDADGRNVRRITKSKGYDGGPFFSPDGKRILYRSDRRGNDLLQVYINNVEGTAERALTEQRVRQLGPVLPPRQPAHHLRHQQTRPRQLRALPDGRGHRRRGADHPPRRVRRPARLLARRQEADVDLQRPDGGQEEPALHRRLRGRPPQHSQPLIGRERT